MLSILFRIENISKLARRIKEGKTVLNEDSL